MSNLDTRLMSITMTSMVGHSVRSKCSLSRKSRSLTNLRVKLRISSRKMSSIS